MINDDFPFSRKQDKPFLLRKASSEFPLSEFFFQRPPRDRSPRKNNYGEKIAERYKLLQRIKEKLVTIELDLHPLIHLLSMGRYWIINQRPKCQVQLYVWFMQCVPILAKCLLYIKPHSRLKLDLISYVFPSIWELRFFFGFPFLSFHFSPEPHDKCQLTAGEVDRHRHVWTCFNKSEYWVIY